jgi:hypothetical protein
MNFMTTPESHAPLDDGRGGFFAVDRRVWALVCRFGMNAAVAYLVLARGTGGDNRTTKWSINAVESYTGISRSRAQDAISELQRCKAVVRDPASKPSRPKYRIMAAHEVPGCEGYPPSASSNPQQVIPDPATEIVSLDDGDLAERCSVAKPRDRADEIVRLDSAIRYDQEAAAKPEWMWLPNALIDGVGKETSPVELVRQTGSAETLRLLVDLYRSHSLDENGGIHFRQVRKGYQRHKVGEQGQFIVWGFVPAAEFASEDAPFVTPYLTGAKGEDGQDTGMSHFWTCWRRLQGLGLVEYIAHLVDADTAQGEIIHPLAEDGSGLDVEWDLGLVAHQAAARIITPGQHGWAEGQGVVALAPVLRHVEGVQLLGIARLRYRPRTSRTLAFLSREAEWLSYRERYHQILR